MVREVFGHTVLESLEEIVQPQHTALVLIDLQNDFLSKGGYCDRSGHYAPRPGRLVVSNLRLRDSARQSHVMVVYTRYVERHDGSLYSAARLAKRLESARADALEFCVEGTWGYDLLPEVRPLVDELVIDKTRGSAFVRTNLEELLRRQAIQTLVITGVAGGGCVEATVRDALQRDFYVVVPRDCVADCLPDRYVGTVRAFRRLLLRGSYTSSRRIKQIWSRAMVSNQS
jgi:nicotinamidase-related amidase